MANKQPKKTEKTSAKQVYKNTTEQEVGNVRTSPEHITTDDIRKRWASVFKNYGSLGFDSIYNVWNANMNMINNPFVQNRRIKQINSPAIKMTKDDLNSALADPDAHEDQLRSVSWGLYYSNYIYRTLLQLDKNTPKYLYYATPAYVKDTKKSEIVDESVRVDKILKKFDPKLTFKTIASQVAIEGKCSYLVRTSFDAKDINFFLLQKLNSNQVKITSFGSEQRFIASFNMVIFLEPGYSIYQYPEFIQNAWTEMCDCGIIVADKKGKKKINPKATLPDNHILEVVDDGKYMYWVQIPQDLCYTFYSDGSHPNAFPDAIGLFSDLNDLGDYAWLQGNLLAKTVNSVLTAEVPLIKDPKVGADSTAISPDTILGYQDFFAQNISANIFPFFAPFTDFELHSLPNQPESMDIIYSRIRDIIGTSGQSSLLPITEKPSVASTLAAEKIQAAKNDYLTRQFETFLNEVINRAFNLKIHWNVFLHGNIFTCDDEERLTKELVVNGVRGLIPKLLSFEGMTMEDYKGSEKYLQALDLNFAKLNVNSVAASQTTGASANGATPVFGRPKKTGNEVINDNTALSQNAGTNVSEIKETT